MGSCPPCPVVGLTGNQSLWEAQRKILELEEALAGSSQFAFNLQGWCSFEQHLFFSNRQISFYFLVVYVYFGNTFWWSVNLRLVVTYRKFIRATTMVYLLCGSGIIWSRHTESRLIQFLSFIRCDAAFQLGDQTWIMHEPSDFKLEHDLWFRTFHPVKEKYSASSALLN